MSRRQTPIPDVYVMAAGEGTRICRFLGVESKALVHLLGRPLVAWVLWLWRHASPSSLTVALRSSDGDLSQYLAADPNVHQRYCDTASTSGTLRLICAAATPGRGLLFSPVDTVAAPSDLVPLFQRLHGPLDECLITVTDVCHDPTATRAIVGRDEEITSLSKTDEHSALGLGGYYYFTPAAVSYASGVDVSDYPTATAVMRGLIAAGHTLRAVRIRETFDVDTPEDLRLAASRLSLVAGPPNLPTAP